MCFKGGGYNQLPRYLQGDSYQMGSGDRYGNQYKSAAASSTGSYKPKEDNYNTYGNQYGAQYKSTPSTSVSYQPMKTSYGNKAYGSQEKYQYSSPPPSYGGNYNYQNYQSTAALLDPPPSNAYYSSGQYSDQYNPPVPYTKPQKYGGESQYSSGSSYTAPKNEYNRKYQPVQSSYSGGYGKSSGMQYKQTQYGYSVNPY